MLNDGIITAPDAGFPSVVKPIVFALTDVHGYDILPVVVGGNGLEKFI